MESPNQNKTHSPSKDQEEEGELQVPTTDRVIKQASTPKVAADDDENSQGLDSEEEEEEEEAEPTGQVIRQTPIEEIAAVFTSPPTTSSSDPSKMSMYQLLSNPMTMLSGINLMRLMAQPDGVDKVRKRMIVDDGKKSARNKRGKKDHPSNNENEGEKILREIMSRSTAGRLANAQSTNDGDGDYDGLTSTSTSFSMENVIPDYTNKLALVKMHRRKIKDLTITELMENCESVQSDIKGIFEGRVYSFRQNLYNLGRKSEWKLKELTLSVPFSGLQSPHLINFLYDLLVPDKSQRLHYQEYIVLVSLSETFLRIYARVCQITLELAEKEMRFKAYYEESIESLDPNAKNQLITTTGSTSST